MSESKHTHRFLPVFLLFVLSLIWGSSFILIKKALISFDSVQVGALRMIFAYLAMFPFGIVAFRKIPRQQWKYVAIMGFVGSFFPSFLFSLAVSRIPSSITGVLNALTPSFTLIVGYFFYQTTIKKINLIGLIIGLIGSIGLSLLKSDGKLGTFNFYMLLVVAAAIFYAFNTNIIKKYGKDIPSIYLSGMSLFFIGPLALMVFFSTSIKESFQQTQVWESLAYVAILGTMGTAFAVILFNKLIQITSAVYASSVTYLIPIVAILWGIIDKEPLYFTHYIGISFILVGVYLVNKK